MTVGFDSWPTKRSSGNNNIPPPYVCPSVHHGAESSRIHSLAIQSSVVTGHVAGDNFRSFQQPVRIFPVRCNFSLSMLLLPMLAGRTQSGQNRPADLNSGVRTRAICAKRPHSKGKLDNFTLTHQPAAEPGAADWRTCFSWALGWCEKLLHYLVPLVDFPPSLIIFPHSTRELRCLVK